MRLPGIRFKAPVAVNLLSGEVLRLDGGKDEAGTTVIEGLPLFDFPVVIAEQDEVTTDDRRRVPAYPALPSVTKTPNPERFAGQIQAYLERDTTTPPPQDAILFVGSSIFRQWSSLEAQMAPLPVFNRAFGGSRTGDPHYMDRIVLPYRPRIIVYDCGSNDVNGGEPADVIAGRAQLFAQRVGAALPKTTVYFVSANRAPQKRDRWDVVDGVNRAMRDYAERASNLKYIDVNTALFDEAGNPRMEMYVADRLHLTPPAYEAFSAIIKPILADAWKSETSGDELARQALTRRGVPAGEPSPSSRAAPDGRPGAEGRRPPRRVGPLIPGAAATARLGIADDRKYEGRASGRGRGGLASHAARSGGTARVVRERGSDARGTKDEGTRGRGTRDEGRQRSPHPYRTTCHVVCRPAR